MSAPKGPVQSDQRQRIPSAFLLAIVGALLLLGSLLTAPSAHAALQSNVQSAAPSDTSAMAFSNFTLATTFGSDNDGVTPRSVQVDLPKGQLGAVQNATACAVSTFTSGNCGSASRIGNVSVYVRAVWGILPVTLTATGPVYRLQAAGSEAMRIGIQADSSLSETMYIQGEMRIREDGSYGIRANIANMPNKAQVNFGLGGWGNADIDISGLTMTLYGRVDNAGSGPGFMFNPPECTAANTTVRAYSGTNFSGTAVSGANGYTPTNCSGGSAPPYDPSLAFLPGSSPASAPTDFGVKVSQPYSATAAKVNAPFRDVAVTLPQGAQLTAATDSDGNLAACTSTEFESSPNSLAPPTCPAGSEVGTVQMDSPLVGLITGKVYLAQPRVSSDLIQLFMMAEQGSAADAVRVKLKADISINGSDRLVATLTDLPAQPIKSFQFNFRSGSAPAMRQPRLCGTYGGSAGLLPWTTGGSSASRTANLVVDTNCPPAGQFDPTIGMTTSPSKASAPTTGVTTITMPIGDEPLAQTKVSLPPGMIANIAGRARCSTAQVAADSCPAGTKVGTVRSLAGQVATAGVFNGDIYMTDAPDAQSIVGLYLRVPVLVGPIAIDTLKLTASLRLRTDFGIDVIADVPDKVRGLQIDMQQLRLTFDATNFLFNPPTCSSNSISADFTSNLGSTQSRTSAMTIDQCGSVSFSPTLAFSASPADAGGPASLTTTVSVPQTTTEANAQGVPKRVVATLPSGVSLGAQAASSAGNPLTSCSAAQIDLPTFAAPTCPSASEVGTTTIQTPSVGQMTGKVYLGAPAAGHTARIYIYADADNYSGKATVKLQGLLDVNASNGDVTVDIDGIPPAAFTSFALTMRGGDHAVLAMPRTCGTNNGSAQITPHHTTSATSITGSLAISGQCGDASSFDPTYSLSTSPTTAGAETTLTQTITVPERHRALDRIALSLPPGLLANIQSVPRCSIADANAGNCAANTKLGDVETRAGQGTSPGTFTGEMFWTDAPSAGDLAGIAIKIPAVVGPIDLGDVITVAAVKLRSDYGIDVTADVPTRAAGVPLNLQQLKLTIDRAGFMTNPPTCDQLTASAGLRGAGGSTVTRTASMQATGCDGVAFTPSVAFAATPPAAGGTSGLRTTLTVAPAATPANGLGAPKHVVAALPDGISLGAQAASAVGSTLSGCSTADFAPGDFTPPACSTTSEVGTTTIQTPSIGQLTGKVYLGTKPSGHLGRILIYADSDTYPGSAAVKLEGLLDVNATTGNVTVDISNVPAAAISSFVLDLRGGDHAVLAMPRTCGTTSGSLQITPHHDPAAITVVDSIDVDQNCGDANNFSPTFGASFSSSTAGASTEMTQTITVPERERPLDHLDLSLPAGLLANIDGVPRCSIADANAGSCAASSKIGTAFTLAGQGTNPGGFGGELFLTDAPTLADIAGIAIKVPAVVGPIDLGNVITIAAVKLRSDYGLDISADVPTRVGGVPLNLQRLALTVDRSGFMTNAVSCSSATIDAQLRGVGGSPVTRSANYQPTDCAGLGFDPSVAFSADPADAAGASALTTTINAPAPTDVSPQAALKTAVVDLPAGVSLSPSINSGGTLAGCASGDFNLGDFSDPACASGTEIGTATIVTPSVGTLTGKVYLSDAAPSGAIAGLYLDAKGTSFPAARVKLAGRVDVDEATGKTTASFDNAPSVVFTSFALTMRGGTQPALSVPRTCGTPQGTATLTSQDGSTVTRTGTLTIDQNCGDATSFGATGSVSLSNSDAGASTDMTVSAGVPSGHRELAKIKITTPDGLLAKLDGKQTCTVADAQTGSCDPATQIGTVQVQAGQGSNPGAFNGTVYLTNAPTTDDVAGIALRIPVQVGPVDLGLVNVVANAKLTSGYGLEITADVPTDVKGIPMYLRSLSLTVNAPDFLFNSSKCSTEQASIAMTSASYAGDTSSITRTSDLTTTNCGAAGFNPSLEFSASPKQADGAGAFTTRITLDDGDSALQRATVQLPAGVSLSPSASSDGNLTGCTAAQFAINDLQNATTCPAGSDVGDVTLQTGAVGAMTGDIYLADSAPAGKLARVFVYARATNFPTVRAKFAGVVSADPTTGIVTADFDSAPQVPFTAMALTFRGGTTPVISLPRTCGTPQGSADFTPYASATPSTQTAGLTIDEQCADSDSFAPTFTNSFSSQAAGEATTMTTTIGVPERHRELDHLDLVLPGGLLANLDGHPQCTIAEAGTASCPANTKIGDVSALAGQGTNPGSFDGELFLTEAPNPGDAAGIAVKLPAIVGPVDLGNVVTIASVKLRPADYGLTVVADIPTRQQGVDLHLRQLRLAINEPGFMTNALTCDATTVNASLHPKGGSTVTKTADYQATGCAGLQFNPQVSFDAAPRSAAGASAFTTTITAPAATPGNPQAALKKAVVDLPTGVALSSSINSGADLAGCTSAQFDAATTANPSCPAGSEIGTVALNVTQVGAMTGKLYLADTAPSGAIAGLYLDAKSTTYGTDAIRVKLTGKIDVDAQTGKTTATFDDAPAVAFTSLSLTMRGGSAPAVSMPRSCGTPQGSADLSPQSGSAVTRTAALTIDQNCGNDTSFGATGSVSLSDLSAARDTEMTIAAVVPAGHRELAKLAVATPPGLLAKVEGKPRCTITDAENGDCAANTEIGTVTVGAGQGTPGTFTGKAYLTDAPGPDDIVGIGLSIPVQVGPVDLGKVNVVAAAKLRADYGLDISADVPTQVKGIPMYLRNLAVTVDKPDFIFNPSTCSTETASLTLSSASYGGDVSTASDTSSLTFTNCGTVPFDPAVEFSAAPSKADGAAAFTARVTMPSQSAALETAVVDLPAGVSLSPSINSGGDLVGCTSAQFDLTTPQSAPSCPAGSQIGDVTVQTPAVGELVGKIYLADTAPAGKIARVMVYARSLDYASARTKFEGTVSADPGTGIVTAAFSDAPPVPFTSMDLTFRGGSDPAISVPRTCGTTSGSAVLGPRSSSTTVTRSGDLTIDQDCGDATSFAPTMTTSFAPTTAGTPTTMTSTIDVPARHRELDRLTLNLPAGVLGQLEGHPLCSLTDAQAGSCAANTKIGTVRALAGQGTTPGTFNGELFLTDPPSSGDAAGVAVKLPAVVGPVDLGNVITIGSVTLRPSDYGMTITADVPTRQQGIDLHLRQLRLVVDESGFMTNAVTCDAAQTTSSLHGAGGSTATPSDAYQATNCAGLGFSPQISFDAAPRAAAGPGTFTTTITAPAATAGSPQGALKKAVVDLPAGVALSSSIDSDNALDGCTTAQFDAASFADPSCPAGSRIGDVTLTVPQVGDMAGKLYLADTAPSGAIAGLYLDAVSTTHGTDAIRVKLTGKIDVDAQTGKTTATFDNAPPIAFTNLTLALRGGNSPAVSLPRSCGTPQGSADLTPQSGNAVTKTADLTIDSNCGESGKFETTGSVTLSNTDAAHDTALTTNVAIPAGQRELAKLKIALPAGLLAKIDGKPRCTIADAQAGSCAASTEIGAITAHAGQGTPDAFTGKVYLTDAPSSDDIVGLAMKIPVKVGPVDLGNVNVIADVQLRSDYGIDVIADVPTQVKGIPMYLRDLAVTVDKPDFLFNPSTCGTHPISLDLESASYGGSTSSDQVSDTVTVGNCAGIGFTPSLAFSATPDRAGGAGAFSATITMPATNQSAMEGAAVTLPAGASLSASIDADAALRGCTDAQFDKATPFSTPTCPAGAKIGDVAISTPTIGAMNGDVYLAATAPGHLARMMVYAASPDFPGARAKFEGVVDVDPNTGVTVADFSDAPEVPFTSLAMTFRGGDTPAISLPRTCGTPQGSAALRSYAGTNTSRNANLSITQDCARSGQFTPAATVTTSPATASAATTLTTTVTMPAGQQELDRVRLSLPKGLVAKVDGHARCSETDANAGLCTAATQVGTVSVKAGQGDTPAPFSGKVFLTEAPAAHPNALVGLAVELPVTAGTHNGDPIVDLGKVTSVGAITLRSDYGIDVDMPVPTTAKGVPAILRELTLKIDESGFMINPSTCTSNDVTGTLDAKQGGSSAVNTSMTITGCGTTEFDPQVSFNASPDAPAAQSTLHTKITLPSSGTQAPLKTAVVQLPAGVSLSASADHLGDLTGCTDAQFDKATWSDPTCPAGSAIGTVTIQTPSVGAITGSAYIAATAPSGFISRIFLDAQSSNFGTRVRIKAEGTVHVDENTGLTTAAFDDLPPVAFTSFDLALRGAPNPVVSLPRTCGDFDGTATLTPHDGGPMATRNAALTLASSCPPAGQFGPQVSFALSPNDAGAHGDLTTTISVPAGDQELQHVRIEMPEGLTAKLQNATRCTIADAQADACPAASKIGTANAKVGVPGAPYTQTGSIYLTEGRNGNIAGMAIILPAQVGPIDLGKVVAIADVQLRSPDLALRIDADVPTTVKGVRLDVRELKLDVGASSDGEFYLLNPSSCGDLTGTAKFTSTASKDASDNGIVTVAPGSCAAQTFDPSIDFSAGTPEPGQPSTFTTTITHPDGPGSEAPFKSATVRLPDGVTMSSSAGHRGDLAGCTDAQFHQDDLSVASTCPAGSEIGTTRLDTELVGQLVGKAYLAPATSGNLARVFLEVTATDVANLTVRLVGKVTVNEQTGITTAVFDDVPAIPMTGFTVTFRGGDAPVLALPRTCGTTQGDGDFVSVNDAAVHRTASLTVNSNCPPANKFQPTATLTRSNNEAGKKIDFTTAVSVPEGNEELRGLRMSLPAGLLGEIASIPACTFSDAQAGNCAQSSRVGSVTAKVGVPAAPFTVTGDAFLVKGNSDAIARLALVLPAVVGPIDLGKVVTIADLRLRGDYGLDVAADDIPTQVKGVRLDLNDFELKIDRAGFMVNPVTCGSAKAPATLTSKQNHTQVRNTTFTTTSCDQLGLDASLDFAAAPASPLKASTVTTKVRATTGTTLDAMKRVTVTMPEGVSLSPSAGARGDLDECSASQFNAADIHVDAACPAGSKVGTVKLTSPMVGDLTGDVYLGAKQGNHFAGIYFQATGPDYPALRVKIAGTLDVDEATGRLTASFDDLPAVQVSAIDLSLRGGDAPVLSLPRTCGDFGASVSIVRHGGGSSDAGGQLKLNEDCPDGNAFSPSLLIGADPTQAGANTNLATVVRVPDRQQELKALSITMPKGLIGRLTVASQCSVGAARAGNCGADSEVGDVIAKVGVGSAPYTVNGKAYMTAGYDGAIAGLMFKLPAKVGPIDLGEVVTMAKVELLPNTLEMRITAPEIPTRVKGIPLNITELAIGMSRPGVVVNASTCGPQNAYAGFWAAQGATNQAAAGYQATGCGALNWNPAIGLQFTGTQKDLDVKGHPTLTTVISLNEGQGTLKNTTVVLPEGIGADLQNISKRWCLDLGAASAGTCPAGATLGAVAITTSALPTPVMGEIIMVRVPGQVLPGLLIRVRDRIALDILGQTRLDTKTGQVIAEFDGIPDAPVSKMVLLFNGGDNGVLVLTKELCGVAGRASAAALGASHGASVTRTVPVDCAGKVSGGGSGGDGEDDSSKTAKSVVSFKPSGSGSSMTFALSNPNGIKKVILRMPRGTIFKKNAWKLVKPKLTGGKAKMKVVNGERRMAISIKPTDPSKKITKVKFKLPRRAIKINIKVRRVIYDKKKTSKKKRDKKLAKLLSPKVTLIDGFDKKVNVKIKTKVAVKKTKTKKKK